MEQVAMVTLVGHIHIISRCRDRIQYINNYQSWTCPAFSLWFVSFFSTLAPPALKGRMKVFERLIWLWRQWDAVKVCVHCQNRYQTLGTLNFWIFQLHGRQLSFFLFAPMCLHSNILLSHCNVDTGCAIIWRKIQECIGAVMSTSLVLRVRPFWDNSSGGKHKYPPLKKKSL